MSECVQLLSGSSTHPIHTYFSDIMSKLSDCSLSGDLQPNLRRHINPCRWLAVVSFVALLLFRASHVPDSLIGRPTDHHRPADRWKTLHLKPKPVQPAFVHPGVLVSDAQLQYVKAQITAGAEPWNAAMEQFTASNYTQLIWEPKPRAVVECGSSSYPDLGCKDERKDAIAAYSLALRFYLSGDAAYAQKSIEIMDAWATTLTGHNNSNAPLQTGWAGASWPKAGELIRNYYPQWNSDQQGRFQDMLRNIYLPELLPGSTSNGNWELVMMEAAIGMAVHLEDQDSLDSALATFNTRLPAYVYLQSDGDLPKTVPKQHLKSRQQIVNFWQGQETFFDGITQETCRDFVHAGYGLASIANIAETMRIQGDDLYTSTDLGERLYAALELHTGLENGEEVPADLCGGQVTLGLKNITEVGYNALHKRMQYDMPNTQIYTENGRPEDTNFLFIAWQTLTHAEQPN